MSLSTFGAIMGFAAEVVGQTEETYKTLTHKVKNPALKEVLQSLLNEVRKNHSLMEQTRRENVTEMILEPITGLQREGYKIDLKVSESSEDSDLLKMIISLEENEKNFFYDASEKIPLPEVSRIFKKIARKKEMNIDRLQSLRLYP